VTYAGIPGNRLGLEHPAAIHHQGLLLGTLQKGGQCEVLIPSGDDYDYIGSLYGSGEIVVMTDPFS
jgi:hypothetical protein